MVWLENMLHTDCLHSSYHMLNQNVFFTLRPGLQTLSIVYCNQVTPCLGSLTLSFVSATSMNDIPTIQGKRIMDITHNRTHP